MTIGETPSKSNAGHPEIIARLKELFAKEEFSLSDIKRAVSVLEKGEPKVNWLALFQHEIEKWNERANDAKSYMEGMRPYGGPVPQTEEDARKIVEGGLKRMNYELVEDNTLHQTGGFITARPGEKLFRGTKYWLEEVSRDDDASDIIRKVMEGTASGEMTREHMEEIKARKAEYLKNVGREVEVHRGRFDKVLDLAKQEKTTEEAETKELFQKYVQKEKKEKRFKKDGKFTIPGAI